MKNKIVIISILAVLILVSISIISAGININKDETKESPLFKIRTKWAMFGKIQEIKTKFFENRIFFQIPKLFNTGSEDGFQSDSVFRKCITITDTYCCRLNGNSPSDEVFQGDTIAKCITNACRTAGSLCTADCFTTRCTNVCTGFCTRKMHPLCTQHLPCE
jgi:hypothetical protein